MKEAQLKWLPLATFLTAAGVIIAVYGELYFLFANVMYLPTTNTLLPFLASILFFIYPAINLERNEPYYLFLLLAGFFLFAIVFRIMSAITSNAYETVRQHSDAAWDTNYFYCIIALLLVELTIYMSVSMKEFRLVNCVSLGSALSAVWVTGSFST